MLHLPLIVLKVWGLQPRRYGTSDAAMHGWQDPDDVAMQLSGCMGVALPSQLRGAIFDGHLVHAQNGKALLPTIRS